MFSMFYKKNADPFASFGSTGTARSVASEVNAVEDERNRRRSKSTSEFIHDLQKLVTRDRYIEMGGKNYSLDQFLPFLDAEGRSIFLSKILDDSNVQDAIVSCMSTMWNYVLDTNQFLDDGDLIYHIFTLKMVSLAIETYLKA